MNPNNCSGGILGRDLPYKVMTNKEIENFEIDKFADTECDLFLWTTNGKLPIAFRVMDKWGFHYSNLMVWNKQDGLCHNGFHNVLEFVLYGYKGRNGLDYKNPLKPYFEAKRWKHSEKPSLFYAKLLKVTSAPRIDIFARKRHFGFDAYGDQVEKQIEVPLFASLGVQ